MEIVGEKSSAEGMVENKSVDDGPILAEIEREEKSSAMESECDKVALVRMVVESESNDITAPVAEVDIDEENSHRSAFRLLQLTCKFDSTTSLSSILERMPVDALDDSGHTALHYAAEQHSMRCIELLLKRRAKTDVKSPQGFIALEIALQSDRMQIQGWSSADKITELLTLAREKDLTSIKILAAQTRDVVQIASRLIVHGNIIAFAALLIVTGDTLITTPVHSSEEHGDGTLFDVIVKKAILMGGQVQDDDIMKNGGCSSSDVKSELRQILLKELELLLRWHLDHDKTSDVSHRTLPTSSVPTPLMRAAQAGDVAVAGLLIDHEADIKETDADGNTALHWCLRATFNTRDIRLVLKLLRHGASITMGNRLGLTPVHIAAGQGHLQALQILLAVEPSSVHATSATKETPLFSAVKGNHYDCVRLLLQHGGSRHVLNLRKQRPIDVADTSDMRSLLSLQESSGRMKDLNLFRPLGISAFDNDYVNYDAEQLRFKSENSQLLEFFDESSKSLMPDKTEMCRYFTMPGGCVRGDRCFYAHGEEDLQVWARMSTGEINQASGQVPIALNTATGPASRLTKRLSEDLTKKIFVGGLSPSVESDDLREFFEDKFGAVMDAIVIGSHAGDHIQSRGFGFVTFKREESVIAAVQAHYVNIFGKKVEIKGAVPRSILPTLESIKGPGIELSRSNSAESSRYSEEDANNLVDFSSMELLCQGKGDLQVQLANFNMRYQGEPGPAPLSQSSHEEPSTCPGQQGGPSSRLLYSATSEQGLSWVEKFKQWLPKFLAEVSNRLKDGEWYPLSSLKGDFRATCGLELDHTAIGYHKLSDFVRSMPESCRMKIVPVGRGPATHMVLLPPLARMTPSVKLQSQIARPSGPTTTNSSVEGRSYAAATCQLPAQTTIGNVESTSSVNSRTVISQSSIARNLAVGQFESQNVCDNVLSSLRSRHEELKLPESFLCHSQAAVDGDTALTGHGQILYPSISHDQVGTPGNLTQEVDMTHLRDLYALLDHNCEGQQKMEDQIAAHRAEYLTTNNFDSAGLIRTQARRGILPSGISPEVGVGSILEDPKTPVNQVNLRPFSTFNHPFTGFLPQDGLNAYSMWGQQQLQNSQPTMVQERRNQQSLAAKNLPSKNLHPWDDSPRSILYPYGRGYSQSMSPVQEAPHSLFSPAGYSPTDDKAWGPLCVYCCERRSLWVATPCNHSAVCAVCKDALYKLNRSITNCPVCENRVDRWIALY